MESLSICSMCIRSSNFRVVLLLSELRPGGMERVVLHLATGLAKRGVSVLVLCLQNSGVLAPELDGVGVRVVALESHSGKDLLALWKLSKELRQFQPSVINVHDYASLPYVVLANIFSLRRPLVFTAHGLLYEGFENLQRRNRFFSRFLTSFAAVSDKVANRHKEYLGWLEPVQIINNGVPSICCNQKLRNQVRGEFGCRSDTHLFLAVGNPRPEKGFEDLIDAVAILCDHFEFVDNFVVAVAGTLTESDYCRMLLRKVDELGLQKHFKFLGFRQDTVALYSAADTFVLSSRSEGLPLVILEAMMAGLPVIATRVGGVPDAVGDVALMVEPKQPESLASAMEQMMNDKSCRDHLAETGKDHVEQKFGIERMVGAYIDWYERARVSG